MTGNTDGSLSAHDKSSPAYSDSRTVGEPSVSPDTIKRTLSVDQMSASRVPSIESDSVVGMRAAEAYVRPTPIYTHGKLLSHGFDLVNCVFSVTLTAEASTPGEVPTEIFLPEYHFPPGKTQISVSGGKWSISVDENDGGLQQKLKWWHAPGQQQLTATGVKRREGTEVGSQDEDSYLDVCKQKACVMM